MSAQITPGPWEADTDVLGTFMVYPSNGAYDGSVVCRGIKNKADADAIAALPELLAVLRRVLAAGTWYGSALELDHDCDGEKLEAEIQAVLAKVDAA